MNFTLATLISHLTLGVLLDNKLSFNDCISQVCCKACHQLNVLWRIGSFFEEATRLLIYKCFIKSHFDYCSLVLYHCGIGNSRKLERIQEHALRFVYDDTSSDYEILLQTANISTLEFQWRHELATEMFKTLHDLTPPPIYEIYF